MAQNKLPKAETYFYFLSWMFAIIYSQYHVFLAGDRKFKIIVRCIYRYVLIKSYFYFSIFSVLLV